MDHQTLWMLWLDIVQQAQDIKKYVHPELEKEKATDNLTIYRTVLVEKIECFKSNLEQKYSESILFYILFPLVSFCDEKVNLYLFNHMSLSKASWESLQTEFFQRRDGGEHFFRMIDAILAKEVKVPIVIPIQINLLLKEGFKGKYHLANQYNITLYEKTLETMIENESGCDVINKGYENVLESLSIHQTLQSTKSRWSKRFLTKSHYISAAILGIAVVCSSYLFLILR
ncbi:MULTISPECIES: DotU family type IV/VI secretion system protein [Cysteiniphilum]|uniref:DotU family type IV/VI secretion system protein n=1 Tax=Cysteiniphilum TaxID=2056696 RepID=UPI00177AAF00|nr:MULTISPECIES: DotU family type IV/VI secretion system protein [Cysteiniphilum]